MAGNKVKKVNKVKITISGPPGSGTTTIAKKISEKLRIPLISAGDLFRKLARERGMTVEEFGRYAESNPDIDMLIDKTQKEEAASLDACVVEGRLSGWMVDNASLKVLIFAEDRVRFERIAKREKKPVEIAKRETLARENIERERYKKYYGIEIDNWGIYDLIINSTSFAADEVVEVILKALEFRIK
ncbi:MAG: AAA family ATPase [Archaeoglobus sp.]|nr:AAA family ATPase [Archaeoglobus sp.]